VGPCPLPGLPDQAWAAPPPNNPTGGDSQHTFRPSHSLHPVLSCLKNRQSSISQAATIPMSENQFVLMHERVCQDLWEWMVLIYFKLSRRCTVHHVNVTQEMWVYGINNVCANRFSWPLVRTQCHYMLTQLRIFHTHAFRRINMASMRAYEVAATLSWDSKTLCGKKNSWALVRQRTIQTERPPLLGEVSANFRG
jgi:hypothetical protein